MLTDKELDHIAKLARIELAEDLRERMKKDLSSILGYVEQLESVDTSGVDPLYQVTGLENQTRSDELRTLVDPARRTELLVKQAPHSEGPYIKVEGVKKKS